MAILRNLLGFVTVDGLLGTDAPTLRIPDFQRPYSWTPRMAAQLFTDIDHARNHWPSNPYVMGTIILLRREGGTHLEVVDGQQRLLTLHLLRSILRGQRLQDLEAGSTPIHLVYQELRRQVRGLAGHEDGIIAFSDFLDSKAQVLRIVTDDEDEAFQFFDSQNFRGKALRPHDLLKAYHLREMADSSTSAQRAVVEEWEKAEENDLDRLFGTYLARIHWWSRNQPAHAFTMADLDIFKGIGRATRGLPGAEYHRAAKAVLPGLQEWASPTADTQSMRDLKRAQHQLDAPVAAGKPFFDYAAFMLAECKRLDEELFAPVVGGDSSAPDLRDFRDNPRFRFCRELYVAAALYYTNKYSDTDPTRTRHRLFRWAYGLRLAYERLGWRSTDNYALGRETLTSREGINLFATIRDSLDPRLVPLENIQVPGTARSRNEVDQRLLTLLTEEY
ncbi:MAG: DUF262 domain-containing protein [Propionibacteriaceae bacterium]|nr:DUF262 domain-containing protein [Propionibacteriaceae bacterium]